MNIRMNLEIHFHSGKEVSIVLNVKEAGQDEKFGEILLFCFLALRQLVNLKGNPAAKNLAYLMDLYGRTLTEVANVEQSDGVIIVKHPSQRGKKIFLADLVFGEKGYDFQMNHKGFGLLSSGIDYYAPWSVLSFLVYLAKKRIADEEYLNALHKAAISCSERYSKGDVSIESQGFVAAFIAATSVPGYSKETEPVDVVETTEPEDVVETIKHNAKYIAPIVVKVAIENYKDILAGISEIQNDIEFPIEMWQVVPEIIFFYLHLIDRSTYEELGDEYRGIFINTLCEGATSAISEKSIDNLINHKEYAVISKADYNARNNEYETFKKLVPDASEAFTGTLFWEFSRKLCKDMLGSDDLTAFINMSVRTCYALLTKMIARS